MGVIPLNRLICHLGY